MRSMVTLFEILDKSEVDLIVKVDILNVPVKDIPLGDFMVVAATISGAKFLYASDLKRLIDRL
jgi:hypothetical protein